MKTIKFRKLAMLSLVLALILGLGIFLIDKTMLPPQEKIEELVKYADNIAYLRQGVNESALSKAQDVKVTTELDERSKDKSELHYIVKLQHKDHLGLVEVVYPCKRDTSGKLMIGVPYRNTKIYVNSLAEYITICIIAFIGFFLVLCIIGIELYKNQSGKSDA